MSIDQDHLDQLHEDYRNKQAEIDLKKIEEQEGKCFLAIENGKAIGLIMGIMREYDEFDYIDYKCPKAGVITELIVSKSIRGKGIGNQLMAKMETYFKEKECSYIYIDVFAYNENAIRFYGKEGYHNRMHTIIKKIETTE